ncbi:FAD-binding oxidoreductase [Geodermatophilus sp. YIM 151500]|uniref:FAD-binding oxidoreductase n=1 Tax=Geodermatophilus sp. YIM 151500 TaxID=2984531 RepID=UPI0021E4EEC1|nr:FAD-binding oxidoreductase [Geodermatophilus sp. YIM 151500]MCV2490637.1 FAD-binding oxidoreductase [Geodermatophilus sp. YIM 151500]
MAALAPAPFAGTLLTPDSPGYDDARRVYNGSIDRRPAFIARCGSADDVAAALALARRHDLAVAVRGGGHSIPGWSVVDGGLVVDLTAMREVRVDPGTRTAVVGPGATWAEFDAAAQQHGLATPGGEISHTGVAGLTLGGGIGWLSRMHGLACDNLLAAELVTAAGEIRWVDDRTDPELMWGLRGGGGNFGVVTSFTFALHPVGPVPGGVVFHRGERAAEVLRLYRDLGAAAPRQLSLVAVQATAPPAPFVPEELRGRSLAGISAAWFGDAADAERMLSPIRSALGRPEIDMLGVLPYCALQQSVDTSAPWGMRSHLKSDFLDELDDAAIDALVATAAQRRHPMSHVLVRRLGGAIADVGPARTAFAHRSATHMTTIVGVWDAAGEPGPESAWARRTWAATRRLACGTYVNHLEDEGGGRVREAYPSTTWARLAALKARLDPENVFRHNQNVPPAR